MTLNERLQADIAHKVMFKIPVFGYKIEITDTIIVMWIIMAILITISYVCTRKLRIVPEGKQNFIEIIVELINNMVKDAIGHYWRPFAPYIGTVLLFLLFANIISIFNVIPTGEDLYRLTGVEFFEHIPEFGFKPPTKDINVPACMAIMSILLVLFAGIKYKKFSGWLKSFVEPVPLMLPFKILEYGIKPLSLCLRLFGNILAAFMIMGLVYIAVGSFWPAAVTPGFLSLYFDLFDGGLQAYVFVFLTSLYIAEAVE